MNLINTIIPYWQLDPYVPGAQVQQPENLSQVPLLLQVQWWAQFGPHVPTGHSANKRRRRWLLFRFNDQVEVIKTSSSQVIPYLDYNISQSNQFHMCILLFQNWFVRHLRKEIFVDIQHPSSEMDNLCNIEDIIYVMRYPTQYLIYLLERHPSPVLPAGHSESWRHLPATWSQRPFLPQAHLSTQFSPKKPGGQAK